MAPTRTIQLHVVSDATVAVVLLRDVATPAPVGTRGRGCQHVVTIGALGRRGSGDNPNGGHDGSVVMETIRRMFIAVPGRLTTKWRRTQFHLPTRWSWAIERLACFDRLPALSLRT